MLDSAGSSILDLNGFNQTVGLLSLGSSNGGSRGYVTNSIGNSTLTLTNGVLCLNHNSGGGGILCTMLDLNGNRQTFTVQDGSCVPDMLIISVIQNGGLTMVGATATASLGLSGVNTYSDATLVTSGTLELRNLLALQNSPLDTSGAGTVSLNAGAGAYTLGGLTGSKNLASGITGTPGNMTTLILNPGATNTYSGVIANGTMQLTKTGSGTQILSGANTYTGATAINGGKLQVATGTGTRCTSAANIADTVGCILGVQLAATNGQWASSSSLTVGGANSQIEIDYGSTAPSTTVAPIKVTTLTVSGVGTIKVLCSDPYQFTVGQPYPLINGTTSVPPNAPEYTGLNLSLPFGMTGHLVTVDNYVQLVVDTLPPRGTLIQFIME